MKLIMIKPITKTLLTVFSLALVYSCSTSANFESTKVSDLQKLQRDITYLASDELEGRETGTVGAKLAADYISKRFVELGISPKADAGSFYQKFTYNETNPHSEGSDKEGIVGFNVIGFINNNAPLTAVIGGHYDHLGYGDHGSLHVGEKEIHNGADDNASGIAAMLLIAERLKALKDPKQNYMFIAFSGEERGLWGSNFFNKNPTIDIKSINYMINMDMVGRLNEERKIMLNGYGTSPEWDELVSELNKDIFNIVTSDSGIGPSDHTSFYLNDIPVLQFFTGQHEDYHRPGDDVEKINWDGLLDIANFITAMAMKMDGNGEVDFTKTDDSNTMSAPAFKVTLGVIPDYLYDGKGMRIDGIREGRPAGNAGMIKGDIVTKMGDIEVNDMMSYMEALANFEAGQQTEVYFMRDGELKYVTVLFD